MKKVVVFGVLALVLSGCGERAQIDQSKMCLASTDQDAKACKNGELVTFKPSSWGNEQLPLNIAAAYCDFNYEVMYNNSGVICVFTDKRLGLLGK